MKKLLCFLTLIGLLNSCSKNSTDNSTAQPKSLGTYTSTLKDTVRVSQNGNNIKFVYRSYQSINTPIPAPTTPNPIGVREIQIQKVFDSIRVASDLTFTNNEVSETYIHFTGTIVPLPSPYSYTEPAIGIGSFGTNTIQFQMSNGGGYFNFSGIKL